MDEIRVDKLLKAQSVFEQFRIDMVDDRDKAGAVQAFEFCYELAWKLMKKILESRGQEVGSPKDTFRKAALEGLIDSPEVWFEFQQKRNLTMHTYERANLQLIVDTFESFSQGLESFIQRAQSLT